MANDQHRRGKRAGHRPERRISVRSVRRDPPDYRKLARALIELAQLQAEAAAQADDEARKRPTPSSGRPDDHGPQEAA